ncbi:hypothetical protein [Azonexus sp.]|jgi:hypothetical protein|uniref:phage tail tube protein n=1 Tax=Azonexus sp. TaxID=1872668 RepID=UPI00282BF0DA|nr:hypothetical protein [Azonexus sp.]MDR1995151.1 hypothetical protein [Azonexus sp.]
MEPADATLTDTQSGQHTSGALGEFEYLLNRHPEEPMATQVRTAIINGTNYITPLNVNSGESLGNVSKMTYSVELDKKELPNYQGSGGNDDVFWKPKSGSVSLSCRHVSIEMMKIALGATAKVVAAGAVDGEAHTVVDLDKLIALDHLQDLSAELTVSPAGTGPDFVEGVDYIRKRAGITPMSTGSMAADDEIEISYTKHKHAVFQALINMITETGLLFDGVNERTGKPWQGKFHRVAWGPSKSLELINDDFASFDIEGEILIADFVTGVGLSQMVEIKVGDL